MSSTLRHSILVGLAALIAALAVVIVDRSARADGSAHAAAVRDHAIVAAENRAALTSEASAVLPKLTRAGAGYERDGVSPKLPARAKLVGSVTTDKRLAVDLSLVPRNPKALAEFATDVATPGSSDYRHYITEHQFAQRFGASRSEIKSVRAAMKAAGLEPEAATSNGLVIKVTGTAQQFDRAFSIRLDRYRLAGGRVAMANTKAPRIASSAAKYVSAVTGLSNLVQMKPLDDKRMVSRKASVRRAASRASAKSAESRPSTTSAGTSYVPTPCTDAVNYAATDSTTILGSTPISSEPPDTVDTFNYNYFSTAYDFDALYKADDLGQGVNVGIFELEPNFPDDVGAFDSCYGIDDPVSYVSVDGAEPAPDSSDDDGLETDLDIETISALAPDASITVYQGNEDADTGWLDTFNTIVSDDTDRVVSVSYGACELAESEEVGNQPQAEVTIFEEAAAQGQTFSVSSGDAGAEGCRLETDTQAVAVDDPAADPYVTGVGGTAVEDAGDPPTTRPTEDLWNDGAELDASDQGGATGGGLSTEWLMPSYQSDAPSSLGVINSESQGQSGEAGAICSGAADDTNPPIVDSAAYYCREVPDVSASADPYYGFTVYYDGAWTSVGGTSGAAPIWSALFADADSTPNCQADPVGFANPALYKIASTSSSYASDFNDITQGEVSGTDDNDMGASNGGWYEGLTGYDMATGLGSPVAGNLVPALCPTPTVTTTTGTVTTVTATGARTTTTVTGTNTTTTVTGQNTTTTKTVTTTASKTCTTSSTLNYQQHPKYGIHEIKAVVYIDGKRVKTVKSREITDIQVKRPKATKFTVKIVSTLADGEVIEHDYDYDGCHHTKSQKVLHKADKNPH